MPISKEKKKLYGKDWKQFSHEIRFVRAGGMCECTGECGIKHLVIPSDRIRMAGARCYRVNGKVYWKENEQFDNAVKKFSKCVLTVAHLCHDETCRKLDHVKAMCQACHLRLDAKHHAKNARATRARKQGLVSMFDPDE